jgi:hypothetical protein
MTWTFLYLMVFLKLPIVGLLWIVWWAIHQTPDAEGPEGDGGGNDRDEGPGPDVPRRPRRGPHGTPDPVAPPRVRRPRTAPRTRTPQP